MNWYNILKIAQHYNDYKLGKFSQSNRIMDKDILQYFEQNKNEQVKMLLSNITDNMQNIILATNKDEAEKILSLILKYVKQNIEDPRIIKIISSDYAVVQHWKNNIPSRFIQYKKVIYLKAIELIKKLGFEDLIPEYKFS